MNTTVLENSYSIKEDNNLVTINVMRLTNIDSESCPTYGITRGEFIYNDITTDVVELAKFIDEFNEENADLNDESLKELIEEYFFS